MTDDLAAEGDRLATQLREIADDPHFSYDWQTIDAPALRAAADCLAAALRERDALANSLRIRTEQRDGAIFNAEGFDRLYRAVCEGNDALRVRAETAEAREAAAATVITDLLATDEDDWGTREYWTQQVARYWLAAHAAAVEARP